MHKLLAAVAVSFFAMTVALAIAEPEPSLSETPQTFTFELKDLPEMRGLEFKELKKELKGLREFKGLKLKEMKDLGKLKALGAAPGDMRTEVAALQVEVRELKETVAKLQARVAELDSPHPKLIPLAER